MLRFFENKEEKALRQFILAVWDKAGKIISDQSSGSAIAKPNEQLIKDLQSLIAAQLPWLLAVYHKAKGNQRQDILSVFAKELILQQTRHDKKSYVINPFLDQKIQLQVLLHVIDTKYKFIFVNQLPLNNFDPILQFKQDIIFELKEWQQTSLIKHLLSKDAFKSNAIRMAKKIKWKNQPLYVENVIAVLPDNLLRDVLNHKNKELEEEFETQLVAALVGAAQNATHITNPEAIGVALLSLTEASLPSCLFGSKEELSRILKPVFDKYSDLLSNTAPAMRN